MLRTFQMTLVDEADYEMYKNRKFLLFQFLQKVYREDLDELIDEADYEMYKNRKFLLFQFLQKVYREDLDELIDEADYEMYKNRKAAKETETEFKKKILTGIKPSQNLDSKKPGKV